MRGNGSSFKQMIILSAMLTLLATNVSAKDALSDVEGSYAKLEIMRLVEVGIINGYEDGTFRPSSSITRADLAKILVLSMKLEEDPNTVSGFTDIPYDAWYRGYAGALVKAGIAQGTSSTTFAPNDLVTREQLAVFFVRAFGLEELAKGIVAQSPLADLDQVSEWARPYITLSYQMGFLKGIENAEGTVRFAPKEKADRQALARLAYEFNFNREQFIATAEQIRKEQTDVPNHGNKTINPSGKEGESPDKPESDSLPGAGGTQGPSGPSSGGEPVPTPIPAPIVVQQLAAINQTTIEVTFNSSVGTANKSDFSFDHELTVREASIKMGSDGKIVILATDPQTRGVLYKFSYKGLDSGRTVTGALPVSEIQAAIDAINALPSTEQLTLNDKQAVKAAREKVDAAKAKGAVDADFTHLNLLIAGEQKISQLEAQLPTGNVNIIQSAYVSIGGQNIPAQISGSDIVSFNLPKALKDTDRFTGFSVQASEDVESITVTMLGLTKIVNFQNGNANVAVSQLLGTLDKQGDGVSVGKLRALSGGESISVTAAITRRNGSSKNITLVFNP